LPVGYYLHKILTKALGEGPKAAKKAWPEGACPKVGAALASKKREKIGKFAPRNAFLAFRGGERTPAAGFQDPAAEG
jgi:hypothetical protein